MGHNGDLDRPWVLEREKKKDPVHMPNSLTRTEIKHYPVPSIALKFFL